MKVLITPRSFGKADPKAFDMLKEAGIEIVKNETGAILTEEKMTELLADCDGIIIGVDPFSANVIKNAPKLKVVSKYGVGLDNIDLKACEERGIIVTKTVGANANAVADFAFTLLLAVARKVVSINNTCRNGAWDKPTTIDVYGKTLGLIGFGAIAKGVAKRASGFDMEVMAYDPFWDEEYAKKHGVKKASLEEIYKNADFISLHVPLTNETENLISAKELAMMKRSAVIINTARGGIINEDDLLAALVDNRIYGAGIDAFREEPPSNKKWFELENVVISPHTAASSFGATEQMGRMAAQNIIDNFK